MRRLISPLLAFFATLAPVSAAPVPSSDVGGDLGAGSGGVPEVSQEEISRMVDAAGTPREGGYCGPFMRPRSRKHRAPAGQQAKSSVRRHRKAHPKARRGVRNGR